MKPTVPAIHLIVYPDGSTNQPQPRTKASSSRSLTDTIFDLQVGRTEVNDGVAIVNQRTIPFNLRADNTGVIVTYAAATDHYLGTVHIGNLDFERPRIPALESALDLQVEVARGALELKALHFTSGGSRLDASGSLQNFAHPQWKLATRGSVSLREISALAAIDGPRQGSAELNLEGQRRRRPISAAGKCPPVECRLSNQLSGLQWPERVHQRQDRPR